MHELVHFASRVESGQYSDEAIIGHAPFTEPIFVVFRARPSMLGNSRLARGAVVGDRANIAVCQPHGDIEKVGVRHP